MPAKPATLRKRQLLLVEWDDISSYSVWQDENDTSRRTPLRCYTVGWRIPSSKGTLTIVSSRCKENQKCADTTTIPRHNVVSVKELEVKDACQK